MFFNVLYICTIDKLKNALHTIQEAQEVWWRSILFIVFAITSIFYVLEQVLTAEKVKKHSGWCGRCVEAATVSTFPLDVKKNMETSCGPHVAMNEFPHLHQVYLPKAEP